MSLINRILLRVIVPGLVVFLTACGGQVNPTPFIMPPGIGLQLTDDPYCPFVEVQAGMNITWTNMDTVDRAVTIELLNGNGENVESGGTDLLRPGDRFSMLFSEPGQYTYYCSIDKQYFGNITVLPISYPYP